MHAYEPRILFGKHVSVGYWSLTYVCLVPNFTVRYKHNRNAHTCSLKHAQCAPYKCYSSELQAGCCPNGTWQRNEPPTAQAEHRAEDAHETTPLPPTPTTSKRGKPVCCVRSRSRLLLGHLAGGSTHAKARHTALHTSNAQAWREYGETGRSLELASQPV